MKLSKAHSRLLLRKSSGCSRVVVTAAFAGAKGDYGWLLIATFAGAKGDYCLQQPAWQLASAVLFTSTCLVELPQQSQAVHAQSSQALSVQHALQSQTGQAQSLHAQSADLAVEATSRPAI